MRKMILSTLTFQKLCLNVSHTHQAVLYTLSWRLVFSPNMSRNQATNMNNKNVTFCILRSRSKM
jgi:hypothetical protein